MKLSSRVDHHPGLMFCQYNADCVNFQVVIFFEFQKKRNLFIFKLWTFFFSTAKQFRKSLFDLWWEVYSLFGLIWCALFFDIYSQLRKVSVFYRKEGDFRPLIPGNRGMWIWTAGVVWRQLEPIKNTRPQLFRRLRSPLSWCYNNQSNYFAVIRNWRRMVR